MILKRKNPSVGLALGSGGAKGLAHIGVIKTLEKHNIPIDYIAGSSIGSLIGAHYAAYKNSKKLEEVALSFNAQKGFQLFDPTLRGGILKGNKIEKLIAGMLHGKDFENIKIPYAAACTDFNTGEAIAITNGDLIKAIRASIAVPAFFQLVNYNGRLLADGGLSNSVPVDVVRQLGADLIIAVNLDTVHVVDPIITAPTLSKIPQTSIDILRHNLALQSSKTADVVIEPKLLYQIGLIGWNVFFNTTKAKSIIQSGADATELLIPEIKAALQKKENEVNSLLSIFKKRT